MNRLTSRPGLNCLNTFFTSKNKWVTASSIVGYSWMNNHFMLFVRNIFHSIQFFAFTCMSIVKARKIVLLSTVLILLLQTFCRNISFYIRWGEN